MIVYAVIARFHDSTVLAESTAGGVEGNIPQVTLLLLQALQSVDVADGTRRTFAHRGDDDMLAQFCGLAEAGSLWNPCYPQVNTTSGNAGGVKEEYYYHLVKHDGVVYVSLTEEEGRPALNYSFLEELHQKFTTKHPPSKIRTANAFAMDKSFSPTMSTLLHHYNTDPTAGNSHYALTAMTAQVEDLKNLMGNNIHLMLKRGENIGSLVDKADELELEAEVFAKRGTQLKKAARQEDRKMRYYLVVAVVLGGWFVSTLVCGASFQRCRASSS